MVEQVTNLIIHACCNVQKVQSEREIHTFLGSFHYQTQQVSPTRQDNNNKEGVTSDEAGKMAVDQLLFNKDRYSLTLPHRLVTCRKFQSIHVLSRSLCMLE